MFFLLALSLFAKEANIELLESNVKNSEKNISSYQKNLSIVKRNREKLIKAKIRLGHSQKTLKSNYRILRRQDVDLNKSEATLKEVDIILNVNQKKDILKIEQLTHSLKLLRAKITERQEQIELTRDRIKGNDNSKAELSEVNKEHQKMTEQLGVDSINISKSIKKTNLLIKGYENELERWKEILSRKKNQFENVQRVTDYK